MSQNNSHILHIGLDVAKLSLQLHLAGRFHSLTNDAKGHVQLLKLLRSHPAAHLVCEASGGYEQSVVRVLQAAQIPVSIVEAGRVRYFARAQGQRAKTDPIDAAVLSQYGVTFQPAASAPATPQQQRLLIYASAAANSFTPSLLKPTGPNITPIRFAGGKREPSTRLWTNKSNSATKPSPSSSPKMTC
jgi:hypothetical protein